MTKLRFYNTFDIAVPIVHALFPVLSESTNIDAKFVISSSAYREVEITQKKPYIQFLKAPWYARNKVLVHMCYLLSSILDIFRTKSDLNIFFTQPPFGLPVLCFISMLCRKDYIVHVMDYHPDFLIASKGSVGTTLLNKIANRLYVSALVRAKHVIAIGDCMRALLVNKGLDAGSISVIRNISWSELPSEKTTHCKTDVIELAGTTFELMGRVVVLYSGNQGVAHEFRTILTAAENLKESHVFIFVGKGKRSSEIETAARKQSNVFLLGYLEEHDFNRIKGIADIHFISLRHNYTGLMVPSKLYSSLQAGKVVLFEGSPTGEVARCIDENKCGYTVPHRDVPEMINVLRRAHQNIDSVEFQEMGEAAKDLYYRELHTRKFCEHYVHVLDQVLGDQIERDRMKSATYE